MDFRSVADEAWNEFTRPLVVATAMLLGIAVAAARQAVRAELADGACGYIVDLRHDVHVSTARIWVNVDAGRERVLDSGESVTVAVPFFLDGCSTRIGYAVPRGRFCGR